MRLVLWHTCFILEDILCTQGKCIFWYCWEECSIDIITCSCLIVLFESSIFLLIFWLVGHILPVFVYLWPGAALDSLYWNCDLWWVPRAKYYQSTSEGNEDWVNKVSHITFADFNLYPLALTKCNHEYNSIQLSFNEPEQSTKQIRKPVIVNEGQKTAKCEARPTYIEIIRCRP